MALGNRNVAGASARAPIFKVFCFRRFQARAFLVVSGDEPGIARRPTVSLGDEIVANTMADRARGKMSKGSGIARSGNHNIPSVARDGPMGTDSSTVPAPGFCCPLSAVRDLALKFSIPSSVPVIRRIVSIIVNQIGI